MAAPETVNVDVRILANPIPPPPGGGGFELRSGIFSGGMLNFRNNGHPGFIVIFNIVDVINAGFRFADDPADALWVRPIIDPGDGCPGAQCTWGQFEAQAVTGGGKKLIVRNRNEYTQRFGFALNVTLNAAGGGPFQVIDPIGNNQNGG